MPRVVPVMNSKAKNSTSPHWSETEARHRQHEQQSRGAGCIVIVENPQRLLTRVVLLIF